MNPPAVVFESHEGVATLTLNQPSRMNALTPQLQHGCLDALERVCNDRTIRVLVLTANGKGFCVGADLASLGASAAYNPGGVSLGEQVNDMMASTGNPLITGLRDLPVPVLCAVNGAAAGGGVGLALAADIVIAARSAYFYLPFVHSLGLVPDLGSSWFLPRAVGNARAVGMTLLGDRIGADRAAEMGLIWRCVADDMLAEETRAIAARLAALPAHAALETRALFRASEHNTLEAQLDHERERQGELADGECFREGLMAFAQKRSARFSGR